ncbi:hypothetical protein KUTeg_024076 [Tegillarca granosa]|uniref:Transmembrane protein 232 n=1 Tax=Tegillarca granosa TaxID=220873 RepID=A0ABQ9DXD3_TEGGR|nr:hypothetical protein KUTeg_024076 [Tegillarca granosa]
MPITKLPIVHKFGIISHSQRLELQERLLKQSYLQSVKTQRVIFQSSRNPLEVSEDFVQQYNTASSLDEREKYEATAHKMLERAKRRAGLKDTGKGHHVNLPMAWTELAQLAQCKGKVQEECLDVLILSLDQSPLERYHIPALFFLAETMLYWLRTDAVHQPYLRTGEIKLLRMGHLTFTRLFYHHMAGQLQGQNEFKNRLFTYLDGLSDCQEAYSPYPNALLSLRFIITVGKIIMADSQIEPGEVKEADNLSKTKTTLSRPSASYSQRSHTTGKEESFKMEEEKQTHSAHSGAISSSVHDLSPTLWHSLDVWRCTNHLGGGLQEALLALSHCGMGIANENWVDSMVALQILAEAAKSNISAMRVMHNLARGVKPQPQKAETPEDTLSETSDVYSVSTNDSQKGRESKVSYMSSKPTLSDIYERSEEDIDSARKSRFSKEVPNTDRSVEHQTPLKSKPAPLSKENLEKFDSKLKSAIKDQPSNDRGLNSREVSFAEKTKNTDETKQRMPQNVQRGTSFASEKIPQSIPGTGWKAEAGTDLPSGRASDASSVPTYTNAPIQDLPGINGWHWEVAITYTDLLAEISLYGGNANIQKVALMGNNREVAEPFKRGVISIPLKSAGLLDLAFFHAANEIKDGGPNDWSWRIRFGAIQSLVKICRCLASDKNREGMRTAAWNVLLRAHSLERDERVLEALKVGQVHTDIESLLNKHVLVSPFTIGNKIATGLSVIYLPPLPPPVEPHVTSKKTSPRRKIQPENLGPQKQKPTRTSLQQEIMLATALYEPPVDFNVRTSFDLRRIVEDQWRKELQQQLEEEEAKRLKDIEDKQKQEEERQREIAERRNEKLKKRVHITEHKLEEKSSESDLSITSSNSGAELTVSS